MAASQLHKPQLILEECINGKKYVAVEGGNFGKSLIGLKEEGYQPVYGEDNALLRMHRGNNFEDRALRVFSYIREGVIYFQREKCKVVRESPILESPTKATNAHRREQEFYPTPDQIEKALEESVDFLDTEIPTNRFNSDGITVFLFGQGNAKKAGEFGHFLRDVGITKLPTFALNQEYVDKRPRPFARQLWMGSRDTAWIYLNGGIGNKIWGYIKDLQLQKTVRGIRCINSGKQVA